MKIYVIDDDAFALRMVSHQLKALGFTETVGFEHAADAVRALSEDPVAPSLILLDLQMPDLDGIEFVRHLATLKFGGGLILVSGEDERVLQTASTLASAYALDVRGVLTKPVSPARLKALLDAPSGAPPREPTQPRKTYPPEAVAHAIHSDELVNYYQPKVDLRTGRVIGVEALVRWLHPTDGLVYPEQFVSVAEEHRLIDPLTRTVLKNALLQARAWRDEGADLVVAVNVSMENLAALDFPDFIERALRDAGVPNQQLVLEVTESRLSHNARMALDIFTRLRLKRIGLSIDDFGTGHSSLAQLRIVPFDELKIDAGFVHGADRDASARAIVDASIAMARQLGLTTVAEGVEVFTDWEHVRAVGCDVGQGYFIGHPMPAETFNTWLTGWNQSLAALIPE